MSAPAEFLQEQAWLYARLDDLLIRRGSDLFLSANAPPAVKVNGQLVRLSDQAIGGDTTLAIAQAIMTPLQFGHFQQTKESNFAIAPPDRPRFRVNAFMQLGQVGMVFRAIAVNPPSLDGLGLPEALKTIALQKRGLVILVGATGAGKTTALAAMVDWINQKARGHIVTVEDPIEYELAGVGQTQVNPKIDLDFAKALRAILRQDPDVIMIGEIRDFETAQIAIQASLTGHLVLATLHTNDAASAVTRLHDMGVEPFLLSSSLLGVLAQRLLRKRCTACAGKGCDVCGQSGYQGRTGIFELLTTNDEMRALIHSQASEAKLREAALRNGMTLMREDGGRLVRLGISTEEELIRVTRD